jgi:hypothetical protein
MSPAAQLIPRNLTFPKKGWAIFWGHIGVDARYDTYARCKLCEKIEKLAKDAAFRRSDQLCAVEALT